MSSKKKTAKTKSGKSKTGIVVIRDEMDRPVLDGIELRAEPAWFAAPEPEWVGSIRQMLTGVSEVLSDTTQTVADLNARLRVVEEVKFARPPQPLHTVHKIAAGQYEYRGAKITEGAPGRWDVAYGDGDEVFNATTLRQARSIIDQRLLPVAVIDRPAYFDVDSEPESELVMLTDEEMAAEAAETESTESPAIAESVEHSQRLDMDGIHRALEDHQPTESLLMLFVPDDEDLSELIRQT